MKIAKLVFSAILVIAVLVFAVLSIVKTPNHQCTSIEVRPHSQNESVLLTQTDVESIIENADIKIIGKKMKDVDLKAVAQKLSENPYVQKINFIHFVNSKLVIDFDLKHIILHVFSEDGEQYFVDENGSLVPFTKKMQDYLIIANGEIHQHYKKGASSNKELTPVVKLAKEILSDEFYADQFRQIYLNSAKQMELVSTIGNHIVLFGTEENATEKLANLKQVYQNGIPRMGFDRYAQLDVRFKNRVIAKTK